MSKNRNQVSAEVREAIQNTDNDQLAEAVRNGDRNYWAAVNRGDTNAAARWEGYNDAVSEEFYKRH